jgi:phosphate transport system permease protein
VLWGLTGLAVLVLIYVMASVLVRGLPHISLRFLFDTPRDMGRVGGVGPLILGTAWVSVLAVVVAAPLGIGAAAYLVEQLFTAPRDPRTADDVLARHG